MTCTIAAAVRRPAVWALAAVLLWAACDDPFEAFLLDVPETPSEATLFDFAGSALAEPPAFDVVNGRTVRVDQTNQWDFLFRISDGATELLPFSALADSATQAGLRRSEQSFEGLLEAPEGGYESGEPIAVSIGDVFVARSRRDRTQILICNQYMKLEVLDIDLVAGTLTFRYLRNPNCGDTVLRPGEHGTL